MKKLCAFVIFLAVSIPLCSCSARYESSERVVRIFAEAYGIDGRIYSSLAKEWTDGYIEPSLKSTMFSRTELLPYDYTLLIHSRLDSVFELGVFLANSARERGELSEMCYERIMLLASMSDSEGRVLMRDNLVVYFFTSDTKRVEECLNKALRA